MLQLFYLFLDKKNYAYKELYNGSIGKDAYLYNIIWKLNVFPLAQYFAWNLLTNNVAKHENLQ